jgi:hypothetical protein
MPLSVKFKDMMNSILFSHMVAMLFGGGEHQPKQVRLQDRAMDAICDFRFWHLADFSVALDVYLQADITRAHPDVCL